MVFFVRCGTGWSGGENAGYNGNDKTSHRNYLLRILTVSVFNGYASVTMRICHAFLWSFAFAFPFASCGSCIGFEIIDDAFAAAFSLASCSSRSGLGIVDGAVSVAFPLLLLAAALASNLSMTLLPLPFPWHALAVA